MEGGQEGDFPPDLLQAIIAKMSFPSVYKAATLSKQWNTKFLNSQNSFSWFRRELHSSATKWPTFSPIFIRKDAMSLLAFNRATSNWLGPIALGPIPAGKPNRWRSVLLAGSLLLCQIGPSFFQFFITNILTKTCRTITLPSDFEFEPEIINLKHYPDFLFLIPVGSYSYKVVVMQTILEPDNVDAYHGVCVHVYDSGSQNWVSTFCKYTLHPDLNGLDYFFPKAAFLDGKMYFLATIQPQWEEVERLKLVSYDLEGNVWRVVYDGFHLPEFVNYHQDDYGADYFGVCRCGEKIIVILLGPLLFVEVEKKVEGMMAGDDALERLSVCYTQQKGIKICEVNLENDELISLTEGPPEMMVGMGNPMKSSRRYRWSIDKLSFSGDADFVYFGRGFVDGSVFKFDLKRREWRSIPPASALREEDDDVIWAHGAFEPGLNPFVSA